MLENRNQFSNMLKNKTKQNRRCYLYDQATFLRIILEESIDRFGMNSLPAGGDICKDVP